MTKLTRRGLGALLAATALSPALARAALPPDKQDYVRKVEAYLNSIHTLQGRFRQINPDGGSSTGTVYVDRDRGEIVLTIVRTGQADQGQVRLAFAERPLELRRWMVTDPQGQQTVVMLENIQLNRPIASSVFIYHDPQVFGWPNG